MTKPTKLTVLHVEDSEDDAILLEMAFQMAHQQWAHRVNVVRVESLQKAWKELENNRPHLVMLDLSLSNESGYDFLRELKSIDKYASIPVLVLSNSSADGDVHASYQLHASGYVTKPDEFRSLVSVMNTVARYWLEVVELPL